MEISRRTFLSGMAIAGAATGLAALGGCSQPQTGADEGAEAVVHDPVRTESCDVVVVGSGTGGMCAATRAAELGAKVILLEKNADLGGSSGIAEGIGAINSYMHREGGISIDPREALWRMQDYHHWAADSNVLITFLEESGATVDWLAGLGVNFVKTTATGPTSYPSWHLAGDEAGVPARNGFTVIAPLEAHCAALGVDIRKSSPATGLISEDGAVKGVYAKADDGEVAIEARAVILASGGYADNEEMFERFTHVDHSRVHNWGVPGRDGDGIAWAMELGAATHHPYSVMYSLTRVPGTTSFEEKINWIFSAQFCPRVNQDGKRFVNEQVTSNFSIVANAVLSNTKCFSVMDQGYVDMICDEALPRGLASVGYVSGEPLPGAAECIESALEEGRIFRADTIEGLAEAIGVPADALKSTIERYNGYCEAGADLEYGVPAELMKPVAVPPYYAAEIGMGMFCTVGGLKVNESMQVLKEDGSVLEGLFAVGSDAGSDMGRDYDVAIMAGSQQGWAATGGRLAAEAALA